MKTGLPAFQDRCGLLQVGTPVVGLQQDHVHFFQERLDAGHDLDTHLPDPARVFRDPPHARLDVAAPLGIRGHHPAARDVALVPRIVEDPGEVDGMGRVEADDPGSKRGGAHSAICRRRKEEEQNQERGTDSSRVDSAYDPHKKVERETGIEPRRPAWEAGILPLNYSRSLTILAPGGKNGMAGPGSNGHTHSNLNSTFGRRPGPGRR